MHVLSVSLHELQCVISRFANLDKFFLKTLKWFHGYWIAIHTLAICLNVTITESIC